MELFTYSWTLENSLITKHFTNQLPHLITWPFLNTDLYLNYKWLASALPDQLVPKIRSLSFVPELCKILNGGRKKQISNWDEIQTKEPIYSEEFSL